MGAEGLSAITCVPARPMAEACSRPLERRVLLQAYQSLMVSVQQFGLSHNILGVHHTLDIHVVDAGDHMACRIRSAWIGRDWRNANSVQFTTILLSGRLGRKNAPSVCATQC